MYGDSEITVPTMFGCCGKKHKLDEHEVTVTLTFGHVHK